MTDDLLAGISETKSSLDREKYLKYLQELSLASGDPDLGQGLGRVPRRGKGSTNGFVGYNFVNDPDFLRTTDPSMKKQPWMPRPVEDVCKTYGHIFRLLTDPRVRKMQDGPQKHSINVSVPQMPSFYSTGGSMTSAEDSADLDDFVAAASEGDAYDAQAPLPAVRQAGPKGTWRSKSSPSLSTGLSGASTTAGPFRPASYGSGPPDSAGSDVSLPALSTTAPMQGRLDGHPLDGMASGIDAETRRNAGLLAGTL